MIKVGAVAEKVLKEMETRLRWRLCRHGLDRIVANLNVIDPHLFAPGWGRPLPWAAKQSEITCSVETAPPVPAAISPASFKLGLRFPERARVIELGARLIRCAKLKAVSPVF